MIRLFIIAAAALVAGAALTLMNSGPVNQLKDSKLFVNSDSSVTKWLLQNPNANSNDAVLARSVANQPLATWLSDNNFGTFLPKLLSSSTNQNAVPVLVTYYIPNRDCQGYSQGGAQTAAAYRLWINNVARTVAQNKAIIILEPDALSDFSCLNESQQTERIELLKYAVTTFAALPNTYTYIDAGHPYWHQAQEMAKRLKQAGIENARGFSLNVSNFVSTSDSIGHGQKIAKATGGKTFVIDTSRNGNGSAQNNEWCNPRGRAFGLTPTTTPNQAYVDAYLWIKVPGESDGECNNGPKAGVFSIDLLRGLYTAR